MNKDKQQELMFKLSMFEQQAQQLQQQLQAIEQGIVEISSLNLGLDELVGANEKEVFASLGKGIFAKTKLVSEDLLVDVGGKNFVKKSIPETKNMIQEQIEKLEEIRKELSGAMEEIEKEMRNIILDVQKKQR